MSRAKSGTSLTFGTTGSVPRRAQSSRNDAFARTRPREVCLPPLQVSRSTPSACDVTAAQATEELALLVLPLVDCPSTRSLAIPARRYIRLPTNVRSLRPDFGTEYAPPQPMGDIGTSRSVAILRHQSR